MEPSNAEPTPRPASPAMYQLDIVLKKGNNLAIRDRTGKRSVLTIYFYKHLSIPGTQVYALYVFVHKVVNRTSLIRKGVYVLYIHTDICD